MQNNITIARPYARAVFEQAQQDGDMEQWSSLLKLLSLVVQDIQMRLVLGSPKASDEQLLEIFTDIVGGKISDTGKNFIKVLISADRLAYVPYISELFEKHRADAEGRMEINVRTAYELNKKQSDRISDAMGKRLGKKVTISSIVDDTLIGGVIIRAGDSVIDASLRGRLTELQNSLTG